MQRSMYALKSFNLQGVEQIILVDNFSTATLMLNYNREI